MSSVLTDFRTKVIALVVSSLFLLTACADAIPDPGAPPANGTVLIPIETVFEVIAHENDVARGLYTAKVVGAGLKAGIKFDEEWQDEDVQAGPLPALFLRGASGSVSKNPIPLGLFLGSDFPISPANALSEQQLAQYELIRPANEPQFFYDAELELHTAMFADPAVVMPCVTCHNEHPESPKVDWELDDLMGATTWTYPKSEVSVSEFYEIIGVFRQGVRDSYNSFIVEMEDWDNQPEIGTIWPSETDFAVPSTETFMARYEELASAKTLSAVMTATTP